MGIENTKILDRAAINETKHLILEVDSKLNDIDTTSSDRLKKAEENILSNEEQIGLLDGNNKYITEQISNIFQTNITIDEKIQDLNGKTDTKFEHLGNKVKKIDDVIISLTPEVKKNTKEIESLHEKSETNIETLENQLKNLE